MLGLLSGVVLVLAAAAITYRVFAPSPGESEPASSSTAVPQDQSRPVVSPDGLVARSGVRLVHVAVTGGGGLLDLRFQVVDPDKASSIHDKATPPAIVDEATGIVADELFMGHAHEGTFRPAVTYYLVFENPGDIVKRGGSVTVLLGDAQVQHVVVD